MCARVRGVSGCNKQSVCQSDFEVGTSSCFPTPNFTPSPHSLSTVTVRNSTSVSAVHDGNSTLEVWLERGEGAEGRGGEVCAQWLVTVVNPSPDPLEELPLPLGPLFTYSGSYKQHDSPDVSPHDAKTTCRGTWAGSGAQGKLGWAGLGVGYVWPSSGYVWASSPKCAWPSSPA